MFEFIISLYADFFIGLSSLVGGYGAGVVLLSLISILVMLPVVRRAGRASALERDYQRVLAPQIDLLKKENKGDALHKEVRVLYRRYSYHPIYAIRQVLPLIVQLPFLIATYVMLTGLPELDGEGFLFIQNLGAPDGVLAGVNLLPFVMTVANVFAALTMAQAQKKEIVQSIVIALIFLALLYDANSGILVYWTINNTILLARNVWSNPTGLLRLSRQVDWSKTFSHLPQVSLFVSFIFCFLTVQALAELFAVEDTPNTVVRTVLFFSSGCFAFAVAAGVLKKFRVNLYVVGVASLIVVLIGGALFVYFNKLRSFFSGAVDLIFYYDLMPIYIGPVLVLCAASIFVFFMVRKKEGFSQKKYIAFSVAAVLAGLAFHWLNNSEFIYSETVGVYFLLGVVFAVTFSLISLPLVRGLSGPVAWEAVGAVVLFSFVMLPTVHAFVIWPSHYVEYVLLIVVFYAIFSYLRKLGAKILFGFFVIFFSVNIAILATQQQMLDPEDVFDKKTNVAEVEQSIFSSIQHVRDELTPPTVKPNIYFLVSESMPDLATLEKVGVDPKPLSDLFNQYGFTVYNDTYTLGYFSLASMSKTLGLKPGITDGDAMRQIVGGYSVANLWLQDIGYQTEIVTQVFMTGIHNAYDERHPEVSIQAGQFDFLLMLLKGIAQREFKFDIKGIKSLGSETDLEVMKRTVISKAKRKPLFMLYHGSFPGHSQNSGMCLPDETQRFIGRYKTALEYLEQDIKLIRKHDPNSIIIVMGDHGPYLTGNCHTLTYADPAQVTELNVRDRIGTVFAVHWPDQEKRRKYDEGILINQDIFPVLFSYLHDSPIPLQMKMKPKAEIGGRTIDQGKFLPLAKNLIIETQGSLP